MWSQFVEQNSKTAEFHGFTAMPVMPPYADVTSKPRTVAQRVPRYDKIADSRQSGHVFLPQSSKFTLKPPMGAHSHRKLMLHKPFRREHHVSNASNPMGCTTSIPEFKPILPTIAMVRAPTLDARTIESSANRHVLNQSALVEARLAEAGVRIQ